MGKASSNKKVARAAQAAGRPGAKRSYAWPLAIGAVVIVGVLLVVLSFGGGDDPDLQPRVGEHWHAAYGVYVCDAFLPPLSDVADKVGIHTHQDGLMHIHPFQASAAGKRGANIQTFAEAVGMTVTDTSFSASGVSQENGDKCGDEEGTVKLLTWDSPSDDSPTEITEDIAKYSPRADDTMWVLAFVPDGAEVPKPESVSNLANPIDEEPAGSTQTTAPVATTAPSSTSAPAESSTTTAAP
jgi:hypothetical protein